MLKIDDISFGNVITPLLKQDNITDVMIWDGDVWVTDIYKGHFQINLNRINDYDAKSFYQLLKKLPRQIAMRMERAYNESDPILDGEGLFDQLGQLRFNCIHECLTGSEIGAIAIRKSNSKLRINEDLIIETGYADKNFLELIKCLVNAGSNIIIAGQTGAGKTELLRFISRWIRKNEAIITIEDTLEAYLKILYPSNNILSLKSNNNVDIETLLKPCLRQNPDWICVSETRGKEVIHLLEAVSTGHHLISTIHAPSAYDIPDRMVEMSQIKDNVFFKQRIYSYIDIGIYISYINDEKGSHRKITQIVEYLYEEQQCQTHVIYEYDFMNKCYKTFPIQSKRIIKNLYERDVDITNIKGVFL